MSTIYRNRCTGHQAITIKPPTKTIRNLKERCQFSLVFTARMNCLTQPRCQRFCRGFINHHKLI